MIRDAIQKIINRKHLTRREAFYAMETIMTGQATPAQIAALLVSLRMKGEQPGEIAGFAESMRRNAVAIPSRLSAEAVDLVGTGGAGRGKRSCLFF